MHHIDAFWLYHVGITPGCIFFIKMKPEELVENESLAFPKLSFRSCKAALWGKCLMLGFSQGKNFLSCMMKADPVQCGWQTLRCAGLKDCGFSVCIFAVPPLWPSQVSLLLSWKACSFVTKRHCSKQDWTIPWIAQGSKPFGHQWNSWRNWITRKSKQYLIICQALPAQSPPSCAPAGGGWAGPAEICSSALPWEPCRYLTASCQGRWSHSRMKRAKPALMRSVTIPKWARHCKAPLCEIQKSSSLVRQYQSNYCILSLLGLSPQKMCEKVLKVQVCIHTWSVLFEGVVVGISLEKDLLQKLCLAQWFLDLEKCVPLWISHFH